MVRKFWLYGTGILIVLYYLLVLLLVQILSINVIIALSVAYLSLVYLSVAELSINANPIIEFFVINGSISSSTSYIFIFRIHQLLG